MNEIKWKFTEGVYATCLVAQKDFAVFMDIGGNRFMRTDGKLSKCALDSLKEMLPSLSICEQERFLTFSDIDIVRIKMMIEDNE